MRSRNIHEGWAQAVMDGRARAKENQRMPGPASSLARKRHIKAGTRSGKAPSACTQVRCNTAASHRSTSDASTANTLLNWGSAAWGDAPSLQNPENMIKFRGSFIGKTDTTLPKAQGCWGSKRKFLHPFLKYIFLEQVPYTKHSWHMGALQIQRWKDKISAPQEAQSNTMSINLNSKIYKVTIKSLRDKDLSFKNSSLLNKTI